MSLASVVANNYLPHGLCLGWWSPLLWLHVGSDAVIAASYFAIPFLITRYLNRYGMWMAPNRWWLITVLFAWFVFACGGTNLMRIVTIWEPVYWAEGIVKLLTAVVSAATVATLLTLRPELAAERERHPSLQRILDDLEGMRDAAAT